MKDKIIVGTEKGISYDKMQIALAIRKSTYEDELGCSLLTESVLVDCESCRLKSICEGIEEVAKEYLEESTKVVGTFSFLE